MRVTTAEIRIGRVKLIKSWSAMKKGMPEIMPNREAITAVVSVTFLLNRP